MLDVPIELDRDGRGRAKRSGEENLLAEILDWSEVLVLSGDVPMLRSETASKLIAFHHEHNATATVLTALLPDATGYGRIVRDSLGNVIAIVEHRDASAEQRSIKEINSGIYVFDRDQLFSGLKQITPNNDQKEYYLTDVFGYFWRNKFAVQAVPAENPLEIQGINTVAQLEEARSVMGELPSKS